MTIMEDDDILEESIRKEATHECDIVQLMPFDHQVGGHNCMLKYNDSTLCKPLNEQEHSVYLNKPDALKDFFPTYHGVVTVRFEKREENILCYAMPMDCSYCRDERRFRNYLIAIDAWKERENKRRARNEEKHSNILEESIDIPLRPTFKDRLLRTWKKYITNGLGQFILLEDVSQNFKYPSSLDLKMGTRGSGDKILSKEKYERHLQRVNASTSAKLGVRFCGMQVFNRAKNEYVYTDKYKGRKADEQGFKNFLKEFIHDGYKYRSELIGPLLSKLHALHEQLTRVDAYRFYCSSLLVMYDGKSYENDNTVEVRMIDFAQSRVKDEEGNHHKGPDKGYILGVESLIRVFTEILDEISAND